MLLKNGCRVEVLESTVAQAGATVRILEPCTIVYNNEEATVKHELNLGDVVYIPKSSLMPEPPIETNIFKDNINPTDASYFNVWKQHIPLLMID